MWCGTVNNFLANHGILMEMFLQDIVRTFALIAFLGGLFLGWLVKECKDGTIWKENIIQPWPIVKSSEGVVMKHSEIHPVRFTNKQVGFIKHLLCQFSEYFEEENADLSEHIEKAEERGPWYNAEGKRVCSTEGWGDGECCCIPKCT